MHHYINHKGVYQSQGRQAKEQTTQQPQKIGQKTQKQANSNFGAKKLCANL